MPNNDYGKVKARLQKLTEKNDIKGLVDMMEDISADQCRRIENGTVEVRTEEYDAVCDYMESLAAQKNEKRRKQLENIYTEVDKRFNVSLIKTGLKADQIYEQIQNKESSSWLQPANNVADAVHAVCRYRLSLGR